MASSPDALISLPSASVKFPNYAEFRATSIRQRFSIPERIIYYMIQNPSSAEMYQKLIECCKYFFLKNPILVYHCLHFEENEWRTSTDEICTGLVENRKINLDLDKIRGKLWVTGYLSISSSNSTFASSLIPKLYNGNVTILTLYRQNISFDDFLFFSLELCGISLFGSRVFYQNGAEVPYEIILSSLPLVEIFGFLCRNALYDFSNTAAELIKIPHFKNVKFFFGLHVSESFDVDTFFDYLKKNKTTAAWLSFCGHLSEEYMEKLEAIVDEVLDAESPRAYIPPFIGFNGQILTKRKALQKLCETYH